MTNMNLSQVPSQTDTWQVAAASLSQSLRPMVEQVRRWAVTRQDVTLLQALLSEQDAPAPINTVPLIERIRTLDKAPSAERQIGELTTAVVDKYGRGDTGRNALIIIARALELANRSVMNLRFRRFGTTHRLSPGSSAGSSVAKTLLNDRCPISLRFMVKRSTAPTKDAASVPCGGNSHGPCENFIISS